MAAANAEGVPYLRCPRVNHVEKGKMGRSAAGATGRGVGDSPHALVHAIVVAYLPDTALLSRVLKSLRGQVDHVHIVDNSPRDDRRVEECIGDDFEHVSIHKLGSNMGVAKAINVGIEAARATGADHVLLSDQDSVPAADMVAALMAVLDQYRAASPPVGAVGPLFRDEVTGTVLPVQVSIEGKFFYGHTMPGPEKPVVEALSLITSGSLIPLAVIDDVGPMREDLFIDYVDIEWCHRARSKGWAMLVAWRARMQHRMGDSQLRVWYMGWRQESAYGPDRVYYRVRNFIALCRMPWIASRWKLRNAWYMAGVVYSQVVFGPTRVACLRSAFRGLGDGLKGRLGPLSQARAADF